MFCKLQIFIQHNLHCAFNKRRAQVSPIAVNIALHFHPKFHFMFCVVCGNIPPHTCFSILPQAVCSLASCIGLPKKASTLFFSALIVLYLEAGGGGRECGLVHRKIASTAFQQNGSYDMFWIRRQTSMCSTVSQYAFILLDQCHVVLHYKAFHNAASHQLLNQMKMLYINCMVSYICIKLTRVL